MAANEMVLYTQTRSDDESEFLKPIVWATSEPHHSNYYGDYTWRVVVRLPDHRKGEYLLSGQQVPSRYAWGFDGVTYYSFNATCIEDIELIEWP